MDGDSAKKGTLPNTGDMVVPTFGKSPLLGNYQGITGSLFRIKSDKGFILGSGR